MSGHGDVVSELRWSDVELWVLREFWILEVGGTCSSGREVLRNVWLRLTEMRRKDFAFLHTLPAFVILESET
jgi:hypothetical protein